MILFLKENIITIIICVIIVLLVILAVRKMIIDKKNGKSSCGGDCSNCMYNCSKKNKN